VKAILQEEKELSAECHEDLLAILAALTAKLSPPAPSITPASLFLPPLHPVFPLFLLSCMHSQNTGFYLFVYILLTLVILFAEWFCITALPCLRIVFCFLCVMWMANLINIPYT